VAAALSTTRPGGDDIKDNVIATPVETGPPLHWLRVSARLKPRSETGTPGPIVSGCDEMTERAYPFYPGGTSL